MHSHKQQSSTKGKIQSEYETSLYIFFFKFTGFIVTGKSFKPYAETVITILVVLYRHILGLLMSI